ncbi:N-acetylgalactosaminyltransferase 7 [Hydra vulgaris]|uniref:Polypeptide N-acetylgalactosaminyltransferase n=1 Tax=Hydra vulgaris TaxID=6087 RepID=A0ABM4D847_HYDVU
MRTIRFSLKKLITLTIVVGFIVYLTYFHLKPSYQSNADISLSKQSLFSSKPVFLSDNKLGNFEKYEDVKSGPGEGGKPHRLKPEQKEEEERLKGVYGFNQLVSDEISLDRVVPDMREEECKHWLYPNDLPSSSVIFIFHNEGWSTLLRSVHSVINRTPPHLLHEIVLVDDKSELEHLHERLDEEIKKPYYQSKVKLVRNKQREGLIRARNIGAIAATGEVLVFLDAHCEVGGNWLPPLIAPIQEDPTTLTAPIIDGINWDDFSINPVYQKGSHSRGIFEWGMLYKETDLPEKEARKRVYHSEPYNSPTHAGGLFAIKRSWFKELGWYDPGLLIWGGENYELSFKLWQCGGRSLWVPCSHVSHVYRGHSCSSCHSGDMGRKWSGIPLSLRNYKRLIEVWFDDKYKEFFYTREPLARFIDTGDVSEQMALKKRMNCKSFTWFMEEIAYDVLKKYPEPPPNAHWGEVRNIATNLCVDTLNRSPPYRIGLSGCHKSGGNQLWRLNTLGQLASGEWCVRYEKASNEIENELSMEWCPSGTPSGPWKFDASSGFFTHTGLNMCLIVNSLTLKLNMARCDHSKEHHKWKIEEIRPHWIEAQKHIKE